ncbi:MAG: PfkB family carbohydrate kinase, partial [Pseudomonadota bacterium]
MTAPLILFGAAHWDLIARPDRPAAPGDDLPGRILRRPGGVAANLAVALAALGRTVRLVAPLGADPDGEA